MKLTRSVSYAVSILIKVHAQTDGLPMTAARISKGCKFPPRFLYRVLRRLVDAGLISGTSGPGGGYRLARDAGKVTLLEIVQAVEQDPKPEVLKPASPKHAKAIRAVNAVTKKSSEAFRRDLRKLTLKKLAH